MRHTSTLVLRFLITFFSILPAVAFSQQTLTSINGWNAYVHLPDDYNSTGTKTYPTIIFLPGTGEVGTNAASLLVYGPANFFANGWNGYVTVNGATVKPIIIALQPLALWPQPALLDQQIELIKKQYRVDPARLSLTGLSMGGWAAELYVQASTAYAAKIASVVAITAVRPDDNPAYPAPFATYARNCGHWLGYEQINDFRDMQTIANTMNAAVPGSATYFQTNVGGGGHCCWNTWYDPTHTDNYSINGVNGNYSIYQYMLSYTNCTGSTPAPPSTPPVVNAGNNQTVTLPAASSSTASVASSTSAITTPQTAYFNFSAAPATVTGWTNLHGSPNTSVITVTNPSGITLSTVSTANWAPYQGACSYDGTGLFNPGFFFNKNISVNNWYQYGDPQGVFDQNKPQFQAFGLSPSMTYTVNISGSMQSSFNANAATLFTIKGATLSSPQDVNTTGTADNGATFYNVYPDESGILSIYVNTVSGQSNIAPVNGIQIIANGTASSPPPPATTTATVTLSGTATPASGAAIVSTNWTETSGGSATITSPSSLSTTVTGLTEGTYVFTLTAVDNNGLSSSSSVTVTVTPTPPIVSASPIDSAGNKKSITLPTSSVFPTDSAATTGEKFIAYPNPVRDVLNINWESKYQGKAVISLYDVAGRSLQTISTTKDGSYFTSQLSLSALKTGVYFLKIQLDNGRIITQKIMKQ